MSACEAGDWTPSNKKERRGSLKKAPTLDGKISTMSVHTEIKKVTTHTLQRMKERGERISMITAYDYSFARIFDAAGIDVILVGDSASNVMAGHETTLPITLDQM